MLGRSDEADNFILAVCHGNAQRNGQAAIKKRFHLCQLAFQVYCFLSDLLVVVGRTAVTAEWPKGP